VNKLIWKGIDSSTIKGLLICELPPITKPKMRVQETVIDGVDGSIIEELGYESYDKTIKIGLTYGFDIDEIIKYFSGEGEVVFSNEPDKYYKASILNRIDYERLLRFREATVKFRVQPFKYQYQEEKLIAKTGSVDGTEIKISDVKAIQLKIDGRSIQDGTPTPETPVEIKSVGYENLFDIEKWVNSGNNSQYYSYENGELSINALDSRTLENFTEEEKIYLPNGIYYLSNISSATIRVYNNNTNTTVNTNNFEVTLGYIYLKLVSSNVIKIQPMINKGSQQRSYIPYGKYGIEVETEGKNKLDYKTCSPITGGIVEIGKDKIKFITNTSCYGVQFPEMILKPNTTYSMYCDYSFTGTMTQWGVRIGINGKWTPVNDNNLVIFTTDETGIIIPAFYTGFPYTVSGDVLELSNIRIYEGLYSKDTIPDYEPYQVRTSLVVLNAPLRSLPNGVKDIAYIRNNKLYVDRYVGTLVFDGSENWLDYSTQESGYYKAYATSKKTNSSFNTDKSLCNLFITKAVSGTISYDYEFLASNGNATYIKINSDKASTKEELKTWLSTHNTQVDYEFKTPVTEELGELTILDLVDGENNISNSENANMVIDYTEILKVNNTGNYISKPIFEIEGIGTINFILNNSNVFSYNFDDDGKVIIDSEKEDAYLGLILKNRNMNGDFPIFNPGENKITWDGIIKNINVVKKSRWL